MHLKCQRSCSFLGGSIIGGSTLFIPVPELQGEPEDVAREKCKIAAQTVNGI